MSTKSLTTLLLAALLFGGGVTGLGAEAWAQGKSDAAKAKAATDKKSPGTACSSLTPNSKAHKDCIQKQAKSETMARPKKPTPPVKPKKTS